MDRLTRWMKKKLSKIFPPNYELDKYFSINYDHDDKFPVVVNLLQGPFANTVYAYYDMKVGEDNYVTFEIKVLESAIGPNFDFTSDEVFSRIAKEIFGVIFAKAVENYKSLREEVLHHEEDRTDYIEEPTPQRVVRKESNTVHKKRVLSRQKRKARLPGDSRVHSKVQPPANGGSDPDIYGDEG
jgi:hypothetical protein